MNALSLGWAAALGLLLVASVAAQDGFRGADRLLASSQPQGVAPLRVTAAAPDLTLRKDLAEVHLMLTATDQQNRIVTGLALAQLTVWDDGRPVATITDFHRESDLPLDIGIVIDASDSTAKQLAAEKTAAMEFLGRVMRPDTDRAFVEVFGTRMAWLQGFTGDNRLLADAIQRVSPLGLTSLFDAVFLARQDRFAISGPGAVRRILVLFTDGEDSYSLHGLDDAVLAAQQAGVAVYAITFHPVSQTSAGDRWLARLTQATGGRLLVLSRPPDSAKAFAQLAQELRLDYSLSYALPAGHRDGRYHRLQVQASGNVQVRTRSGYLAPER